jgi:magnesium transporter
MEEKPFGFLLALIISVGTAAAAWWFFRHKRLV